MVIASPVPYRDCSNRWAAVYPAENHKTTDNCGKGKIGHRSNTAADESADLMSSGPQKELCQYVERSLKDIRAFRILFRLDVEVLDPH